MTKADAKALIDEIGKLKYNPTPLEVQFLKGLAVKIDNEGEPLPTEKQGNYLQLIYRRASKGSYHEIQERF